MECLLDDATLPLFIAENLPFSRSVTLDSCAYWQENGPDVAALQRSVTLRFVSKDGFTAVPPKCSKRRGTVTEMRL